MPKLVTDPELLKQLNADDDGNKPSAKGKPVTDPKLLEQLNAPEPQESRIWQLLRGAGKGIGGLGTSIEDIMPSSGILGGELPGLPESAKKARKEASKDLNKFVQSEDKSAWETGGKIGGQVLPFAFLPGVGATSTLGSIAERAAIGAVAGGAQPTSERTAASHLPGAAAGAATGGLGRAILGRGSGLLGKAGALHTGVAVALEPTVANALESVGLPKKYAHAVALALAAGIVGGSAPPMLSRSLLGEFATRFGSAGAGMAAEKVTDELTKRRPSASQ